MAAITEAGFQRPGFAELLDAQQTRAKKLFGDDIDTGEHTALGKFIRIVVYDLAALYETMEMVYLSRFPGFAAGVQLDRLTPFVGLRRNPAVAAAYRVTFYGRPDTTIDAGFTLATEEGVTYCTELPLTLNQEGTATATVHCTERGAIGNLKRLDELSILMNPDARIDNVLVQKQLAHGRGEETDAELRHRFEEAMAGAGSATANAIKAAVLRVPGVSTCVVQQNTTDTTDQDGLPAHSFEVHVQGDTADEYHIAEAIFAKKPLGIHAAGDELVTVSDDEGGRHPIRFSRVQTVDVGVRVTVCVNHFFAADGESQLRQALHNFLAGYVSGQPLMVTSLYPVLYGVDGVVDVTGLALSTDGGDSYAEDNIKVSPAEAVRLCLASTVVEVRRDETE